jgi:hypothetical protein
MLTLLRIPNRRQRFCPKDYGAKGFGARSPVNPETQVCCFLLHKQNRRRNERGILGREVIYFLPAQLRLADATMSAFRVPQIAPVSLRNLVLSAAY